MWYTPWSGLQRGALSAGMHVSSCILMSRNDALVLLLALPETWKLALPCHRSPSALPVSVCRVVGK